MTEEFLPICVDLYPGNTMFDPTDMPDLKDMRQKGRNDLALARFKLWDVGQELRIRFLDGSPELHARVEAVAKEWLRHANLDFNFGNHANAEIRITFQESGYRSLVGTDAMLQPEPFRTMALGGFTVTTSEDLFRRVVLHEFGHAIGCVHEQSSPNIDIPWDKEAVYKYYWEKIGWDKEKVDHNVLKRYSKSEVDATEHDPVSIMQYPVRNEHTIGDFQIGWNLDLSEKDKAFIATMYPYPEKQ